MSCQMNRGPPDDLKVAELVKVSLGVLSKMAIGAGTKMVRVPCLYFYILITTVHFQLYFHQSPQVESIYRRLYLALILKALLMLKTSRGIWYVAEQFTCSRGFLQNMLNSVASYISCLVRFTEVHYLILWAHI